MKISEKWAREIANKITSMDMLPTFEESNRLLCFLDDKSRKNWNESNWGIFCRSNRIHNVYNVEFVASLANEIRKINESSVIEICAGDGKLSNQLRRLGIEIVASDAYTGGLKKYASFVEKLSHEKALKKY